MITGQMIQLLLINHLLLESNIECIQIVLRMFFVVYIIKLIIY